MAFREIAESSFIFLLLSCQTFSCQKKGIFDAKSCSYWSWSCIRLIKFHTVTTGSSPVWSLASAAACFTSTMRAVGLRRLRDWISAAPLGKKINIRSHCRGFSCCSGEWTKTPSLGFVRKGSLSWQLWHHLRTTEKDSVLLSVLKQNLLNYFMHCYFLCQH